MSKRLDTEEAIVNAEHARRRMGQEVGVFNGTSIPTFYNTTTFRSRLEARWAVFMDHLNVRWFYEYEGFELKCGRYVPDFWLPDLQTFIEIKPRDFNLWADKKTPDHEKCLEFMTADPDEERRPRLVVFAGAPAEQDDGDRWYENESGWVDGDNHYLWCVCPDCGKPGIQFDGRGARVCGERCSAGPGTSGDKGYSFDDGRILRAKSRSVEWRFH